MMIKEYRKLRQGDMSASGGHCGRCGGALPLAVRLSPSPHFCPPFFSFCSFAATSQTSYRITVRQLESMIRLTEALARLHCSAEVSALALRHLSARGF